MRAWAGLPTLPYHLPSPTTCLPLPTQPHPLGYGRIVHLWGVGLAFVPAFPAMPLLAPRGTGGRCACQGTHTRTAHTHYHTHTLHAAGEQPHLRQAAAPLPATHRHPTTTIFPVTETSGRRSCFCLSAWITPVAGRGGRTTTALPPHSSCLPIPPTAQHHHHPTAHPHTPTPHTTCHHHHTTYHMPAYLQSCHLTCHHLARQHIRQTLGGRREEEDGGRCFSTCLRVVSRVSVTVW